MYENDQILQSKSLRNSFLFVHLQKKNDDTTTTTTQNHHLQHSLAYGFNIAEIGNCFQICRELKMCRNLIIKKKFPYNACLLFSYIFVSTCSVFLSYALIASVVAAKMYRILCFM